MKKQNKVKIFIIVAVVEIVLVLAFIGYNAFLLTYKSKELATKTSELQNLIETSKTVESLKSEIEKSKSELESAGSKFFNDDLLLFFFKNLYDAGLNEGVTVKHISFGTLSTVIDGNPPLKTIPVNFGFEANYDSAIKFLNYLENYTYHIKEVNLTFNGRDCTLDVVFYIFTNSKERWVYEGKVSH